MIMYYKLFKSDAMKKILLILVCIITSIFGVEKMQEYNKLTSEEERIIINKGTEAPFSGQYNDFYEEGVYQCAQCNAPLYKSNDKFKSGCGWPSFDDEIEGAVKRTVDADGMRVEITCNNCGGHLGHVFEGEYLTEKNVRHCVNSVSIKFVPAAKEEKAAYFAGGCFWGVEHHFENLPGVKDAVSGYMGGKTENPTYNEVSYKNTGHVETVKVTYDPSVVSYETLAKLFFEIHDPTQTNGQGPDIGEQYLSVIFYNDEKEKDDAQKLINILKEKGYKVATTLRDAKTFYDAEDYHQDYYKKTGKQPYCHVYQKRF